MKTKKIFRFAVISLLFLSTLSMLATALVRADPSAIRFRLLAVERYFDTTRMKEGRDLITALLGYQNWDNSTPPYVSYIHLLTMFSKDDLPDNIKPFYRGDSTKANLESEIKNFLGQAGDEEIVILYYCGHGADRRLDLDASVWDTELIPWLSWGGLPDAYVNVILDTCHSGSWINDGASPGTPLGPGHNVLAACEHDQSAWCWDTHTAFTNEGLIPGFGSATDANGDGWISVEEVFVYAAPVCTSYAAGYGKTQEPCSWYDVCTGNIPIVWRDTTEPFPDFAYPTTTLSIGAPKHTVGTTTYVTSATPFTLTAEDLTCPTSDVDFTKYRIDTGPWTTYTAPFSLPAMLGDGSHTIYYYSKDNAGNEEPQNSLTVFLDNTPPTVEVVAPPDGYVYGQITIQIEATDAGSGVDYVEYSLDESTWVPTTYNPLTYYEADWDTASIPEGDYTVYARAFDHLGNEGRDPEPPEVTVVHLELSTSFTDSDFNPIEEFSAIFSAQKPPMYKLSTNPGTFYEIIEITNTGSTVTLPSLELDVSIPIEADFLGPGERAFKLIGAKPVHIYLNGVEITPAGRWLPDLSCLLVEQALSPGDTIKITIHYEYAFKGNSYSAAEIDGWTGEDYIFETTIMNAFGPSWTGTLTANAVIE